MPARRPPRDRGPASARARASVPASSGSTASRGRSAEDRAVAFLVDRGYAIVERNYRTRIGELDVIAREGDTLVFVEVRSRASAERGSPLETVGPAKQRKVAQVAAHYLAVRAPRAAAIRFDVVGIVGAEITLVRDAFRL